MNIEVLKERHSWIAGFFLAFPFAYPSVPYYWISFCVFLSMLIYIKKLDVRVTAVVISAMCVALVSNILGLGKFPIDTARIISTTLFFCFFFFGYLVPNVDGFFRGFFTAVVFVSVVVITASIFVAPYDAGLLMFSVPSYRLWGAAYFPDWPNYLAFMLALGALVGAMLYKSYTLAALCLIAAFITTSRTPLFALFVFFAYVFVKRPALIALLGTIVFCGVLMFFSMGMDYGYSEFVNRMLLFSDREEIYSVAWELFLQSPFIGHGGVLLDETVGNFASASFHNSYLDFLVRHGVLDFLLFLLLITPTLGGSKMATNTTLIALIVFFLISSFFQNFFRHPHLMMIYTVILAALRAREFNSDER